MIFKRLNEYGDLSIYTNDPIYEGDLVFSTEEILSDEKEGWIEIPFSYLKMFKDSVDHETFEKFCYNITSDIVRGPIHLKHVTHESNFIDHSCDPNISLDEHDNWIAKKDIDKGEQLTIDYGTLLFCSRHNFQCRCETSKCRGRITPEDWKKLCLDSSTIFPSGVREYVERYLNSDSIKNRKIFSLIKRIFC